jgi:hypothetical protein
MHNEPGFGLHGLGLLKQRTLRCFHRRVPWRSSNQQLLRTVGTKCGAEESCICGPEVALMDRTRLKTFAIAVNHHGFLFQKEALSLIFDRLKTLFLLKLLAKRALTPFQGEKQAF